MPDLHSTREFEIRQEYGYYAGNYATAVTFGESGQAVIWISARKVGESLGRPLVLAKEQLIELLHKVSYAGMLAHSFFKKARKAIEI